MFKRYYKIIMVLVCVYFPMSAMVQPLRQVALLKNIRSLTAARVIGFSYTRNTLTRLPFRAGFLSKTYTSDALQALPNKIFNHEELFSNFKTALVRDDYSWEPLNKLFISDHVKQRIWQMYQASYGKIGARYSSFEEMLDDVGSMILMYRKNDPLPQGFMGYKITKFGNKIQLAGTVGTLESKEVLKEMLIKTTQLFGWYSESSGSVAYILFKAGIQPIQEKTVIEKVLGKTVIWLGDGKYQRLIGGIGLKEKYLFGKPIV